MDGNPDFTSKEVHATNSMNKCNEDVEKLVYYFVEGCTDASGLISTERSWLKRRKPYALFLLIGRRSRTDHPLCS